VIQAEGGVFVSSQRNKISIVPSATKTETTITTTSMKVAPSFEYRRSLRRGVARGNINKLTICKFTAGLNDSMLVQCPRGLFYAARRFQSGAGHIPNNVARKVLAADIESLVRDGPSVSLR
jgi:hypothetical protein